MKIRVYFLIMSLIVSGCHLLTPANIETNKYVLNEVPNYFPHFATHELPLLILFPDSNSAYNTRGIAYTREPYLIEYYTKNEWNATPAQMFYPLMIKTFQHSHAFKHIMIPPFIGNNYIVLKTQIIEFLQDFTCEPAIFTFTLQVQVVNNRNKSVKTKLLTIEEPIVIEPPFGGIVAANRATERMLKELIHFTTQSDH